MDDLEETPLTRDCGWNHPQCLRCWFQKWGWSREPARVNMDDTQRCCYCGLITTAGIYVRLRPGNPEIPYCNSVLNAGHPNGSAPTN